MRGFQGIQYAVVFLLVFTQLVPNRPTAAASFEVTYSLVLEQEDFPVVTVRVRNYPGQTAAFVFMGEAFSQFTNLTSVFTNIEVEGADGRNLPWQWGNKRLLVMNPSGQEFSIRYTIAALNFVEGRASDPDAKKYAVFRARRIYFLAGNVFRSRRRHPRRSAWSIPCRKGPACIPRWPNRREPSWR